MASKSSGTWLDTKTNKVVTSQPEEGVQLVSPNAEATPDDERRVEATKASLAEVGDASTEGDASASTTAKSTSK